MEWVSSWPSSLSASCRWVSLPCSTSYRAPSSPRWPSQPSDGRSMTFGTEGRWMTTTYCECPSLAPGKLYPLPNTINTSTNTQAFLPEAWNLRWRRLLRWQMLTLNLTPMLTLTLNLNPNPYTILNQKPNDKPHSYSLSPEISPQERLSLEQMSDHLSAPFVMKSRWLFYTYVSVLRG